MPVNTYEQGGWWRRATHKEWVQQFPLDSRPYHLEMPVHTDSVASLMEYPINQEMAICVPLAFAELGDDARMRFEGYCKASLFLARQMVKYWDMQEEGVPFFIGVSANGFDIFKGYATQCDFPDERIIVLPDYADKQGGWFGKFDLFSSPDLAEFKRLLHVDASMWLQPLEPRRAACRAILDAWGDRGFLIRCLGYSIRDPRDFDWPFAEPDEHPWVTEIFAPAVAEALGTDVEYEREYWNTPGFERIWGGYYGFSRKAWVAAQKVLAKVWELGGHDEPILSVVAREVGWEAYGILRETLHLFYDVHHMHRFRHHEMNAKVMPAWQTEVFRETEDAPDEGRLS